jgi:hypothetical protein
MPNFQSAAEVVDERILAIQVDPPELANGAPIPASGTATALVVDPTNPIASVAYEWRGCAIPASTGRALAGYGSTAAGPSGRCDEKDPATFIEAGSAPLGTLTLTTAFPPAVAALLAEPENGQPVMALRLQLKVSSPAGFLYAIKDVALTRAPPPDQPPNKNPVIMGVEFDGATLAPGDTASVTWGVCAAGAQKEVTDWSVTNPVPAKVCTHTVKPLFDDLQSEPYQGTTLTGQQVATREALSFSFFTTHGSFSNATTTLASDGSDLGLQTRWEEPVAKKDFATIWIVVRDGRGGESWTQYQVTML